MSANPNFASVPNVGWAAITTANNVYDGTGTVATIFTAGTNGAYLGFARAKPKGTNVASVLRLFLNNGGSNATATNNVLIGELGLPATTAIATGPLIELAYPLGFAIPAGYKVLAVIGTTVAAGWDVACAGGDL